jgi:hypothetical protein
VADSFKAARAADPSGKLKLFYNEYGAEGLGEKSDKVRTRLSTQRGRVAGLVDCSACYAAGGVKRKPTLHEWATLFTEWAQPCKRKAMAEALQQFERD